MVGLRDVAPLGCAHGRVAGTSTDGEMGERREKGSKVRYAGKGVRGNWEGFRELVTVGGAVVGACELWRGE